MALFRKCTVITSRKNSFSKQFRACQFRLSSIFFLASERFFFQEISLANPKKNLSEWDWPRRMVFGSPWSILFTKDFFQSKLKMEPTCKLRAKCLKADEGLEKCYMPYFLAASHTSWSDNTPTQYIDLMLSMVAKTVSCMMAPQPHLTYPSLTNPSCPSSLSPIVIIPSHWRGGFQHED